MNLLSVIKKGEVSFLPERMQKLFGTINRRDKFLDVSAFFPYADPSCCVIDYRRIIPEVMDIVQVFSRMEIYLGVSVSTVQHHIWSVSRVFEQALKLGVWDYRLLQLSDLKQILNNGGFSSNQCFHICTALKKLYLISGSFFGSACTQMDTIGLERLTGRYSSLVKATQNAHKTPDIDSMYYEELETRLPLLVADETLPINYRMCAALLWLELYTGLRPSELLTLKTTSRFVSKTNTGKVYNYLSYGVPKLAHGGQIEKYAECFMLPGAVAAFESLLLLRKQIHGYNETDRLFILEREGNINYKRFNYYVTRLFMTRLKDLVSNEWNDVKLRVIDGKSYHIPNLTQYRVHLCGYLYRQGIGVHIIELGMSHLTDSMIAYYVRVQDKTFKDSQSRIDTLIRTRINNDFDLEDHVEKGEELLRSLLLSLAQFHVSTQRLNEMRQKGYDYEVDRYTKKCRSIVFSELRPGLDYFRRTVSKEGKDTVLRRFPALVAIIDNLDSIEREITIWEKKL